MNDLAPGAVLFAERCADDLRGIDSRAADFCIFGGAALPRLVACRCPRA